MLMVNNNRVREARQIKELEKLPKMDEPPSDRLYTFFVLYF
jgi:hypothetical protein